MFKPIKSSTFKAETLKFLLRHCLSQEACLFDFVTNISYKENYDFHENMKLKIYNYQ